MCERCTTSFICGNCRKPIYKEYTFNDKVSKVWKETRPSKQITTTYCGKAPSQFDKTCGKIEFHEREAFSICKTCIQC